MRIASLLCALLVVGTIEAQDKKPLFTDDFENGAENWQPSDANAWQVEGRVGAKRYYQHQQSKYTPPHRSPLNYSLIKKIQVSNFVLSAKALSTGKDGAHRDMCLFFGYQDPAHFYYVHIAKKGDDRANQIFIVNGKDRVKISTTTTEGTPWDEKWHNVKVVREVDSGKIEIYWDDMKKPIMTAQDKTFTWGQVGIGSFDDTGLWDDVVLFGDRVEKK